MLHHPFDDMLASIGAIAGAIAALGVIATFGRRWVRQAVATILEQAVTQPVEEFREELAAHGQAINDLRADLTAMSGRLDTFRTMFMSYLMRGSGPGSPAG